MYIGLLLNFYVFLILISYFFKELLSIHTPTPPDHQNMFTSFRSYDKNLLHFVVVKFGEPLRHSYRKKTYDIFKTWEIKCLDYMYAPLEFSQNLKDLLWITIELTYGEIDFPKKDHFWNSKVFFGNFSSYIFLNFSSLHSKPIILLLLFYN